MRPKDPEYIEQLKAERKQAFKHDSEPLAWSAAETAEKLFELFEKLTRNRKIEDMEDVAARNSCGPIRGYHFPEKTTLLMTIL
jgi:NTP pyrophosphatase (non-canonical NTP hydrolase)